MQTEHNIVKEIVSQYTQTSVSAHQFFISWNSVATLAYTGFSRTLLAIKRGIEDGIPGLKPENQGSKWPKTTFGCLHENVTLTEGQVHQLRDICAQYNAVLQRISESDRTMAIREIHLVTFHCRTLERRLFSQAIPLEGKPLDDDRPPQSQIEAVAGIMDQFRKDRHDQYFPELEPKGRTIKSYYRVPHIESTLVYDLRPSAPLTKTIADFQAGVNQALPHCYAWFQPTSWHMTVRALVSEKP
jgi:hypothetical protein